MNKPDLSTLDGVVKFFSRVAWDGNWSNETAAFIAECVRVAEITASAAAGPFDNTPEGRTASRRVMTRLLENERLRVAFDEAWRNEGFANKEPYPESGPGIVAFTHDLRNAMKGETK